MELQQHLVSDEHILDVDRAKEPCAFKTRHVRERWPGRCVAVQRKLLDQHVVAAVWQRLRLPGQCPVVDEQAQTTRVFVGYFGWCESGAEAQRHATE